MVHRVTALGKKKADHEALRPRLAASTFLCPCHTRLVCLFSVSAKAREPHARCFLSLLRHQSSAKFELLHPWGGWVARGHRPTKFRWKKQELQLTGLVPVFCVVPGTCLNRSIWFWSHLVLGKCKLQAASPQILTIPHLKF